MELTEYDALKAYATMFNTLSIEPLEGILAEDFVYESQMTFEPLESKQEFLDYMTRKLQTIANSDAPVFAEMGTVGSYGDCGRIRPCVIVAQYDKSNLMMLVFARVEDNKLKHLHLCVLPRPETAERSGEYPGLGEDNDS